jgi:hypothetical protein
MHTLYVEAALVLSATRRWAMAAGVCFTLLAADVATAQPAPDDLPVFDAHLHYSRDAWSLFSVDEIFALLDEAGVYKAFVSSTPDDGTLQLHDRAPDRIVPNLRPYRLSGDLATWAHDASVVPYLQDRLEARPRTYRGIGEFHLLVGDIDSSVPRAVAALGAEGGLILQAHADASAVRELLLHRPDITVLWAHAGMSASPATVERLLEVHPNLWVELALRYDVAPDGRLDPRWADLFARYPDRFMIGTDTWIPSQWTRLPTLMAAVRGWLRQLPPDLAAAIAYGNAERVLAPAQPVQAEP